MAEQKEQAEQIRARLSQLERGGRLRARDVLEDARDPGSPLHGHFEWDDGVAGERYRLIQARRLIRSVEYVPAKSAPLIVSPQYIRDPEAPAREEGYVRTVDLATDRTRAVAAMRDELARVTSLLERALRLAAVLGLTEQVKDIQKQVRAIKLVA